MNQLLARAKELAPEIIAHRRHIHQNPEIGHELPSTTKYVMEELTKMGYAPTEICQSGVVATVGKPGKTFLLRADMDALPMQEATSLPFASCNGYAHTCGHDSHTAMLLGAAKLLKEHEQELCGTVKLMFQPAEEILAGAKAMVSAGLLEQPHVDAAMAIHVNSLLPCGHIAYSNGPCNASADAFAIHIKGRGGHGASPEQCIDPINAACHLHLALQELIAREVAGVDTAVLTIGHMTAGDKENIIPETALMRGTLRTYSHEIRTYLKQRMEEVVEGVCKTFRCEGTLEFPFGIGPNVNDITTQNEVIGYVTDLLGAEQVELVPPSMGSEDFSVVAEHVPSVFLNLGAMVEDPTQVFSLHSPNVLLHEDAFAIGTAVHAHVAMEWLKAH